MAPSKSRDRLSVLAHCARGGSISYGPRKAPPQVKPAKTPQTPLTPLTPVLEPSVPEDPEAEAEAVSEQHLEPAPVKPAYLGQYFGQGVPRLDGSSERPPLAPKLPSGEPRAKSYQPAKTLGEGVAPSYVHPPKWSFGGGKSRSAPVLRGGFTSGSLAASLRRRPVRSLSRGFGSGRGRQRIAESPGPGAYDLVRVGDEVPVWAGGARLPWGTRTGLRSKLAPTASDVGPGEYTAQASTVAGPTCKIGQKLQDLKDSRIDYPAPGHYPLGSTLGRKAYKKGCHSPGIMGSGQRTTMSSKDDGPGFYDPGVEPTTHAQFWSQGERKSWLTADPDDPPGPGAYDPPGSIEELEGKPSGWPKDEKQFRKLAGTLPDTPGAEVLHFDRLGWGIRFRGRLPPPKEEQRVSPDAYHPNMDLVTHNAGMPRPLHRTSERRVFDIRDDASEALFKAALKDSERKPSAMYDTGGPSWSMPPRRPPLKAEEGCASMYGPWSSID